MKLIVKVLFKFIQGVLNLVLLPLNTIVVNALPSLNTAFTSVTNFCNWLADAVAWVLSWLPFTTTFYQFLVSILTFHVVVTVAVHGVKLVVKWWHALAP